MASLELQQSVEIDNLLDVMAERMGKTYLEVETMADKEYLTPESNKTFVTTRFGKRDDEQPLRQAIYDLMIEMNIVDLYITYPI